MRVLVESRPRFPIPQEQFPALLEAFAGWRERYRPIMEAFWFFSDGAGGGGIVVAPDDEALAQMFLEYPFGPFSEVRLTPIADGDGMIARWREALRQMGAGQG